MRALLERSSTGPSSRRCGRVTAAILVTSLLAGCHAQQRVDIPGAAPPRPDAAAVQPGDRVKIRLESGTTVGFEVAEVRPDALVSTTGQRVTYQSMTRLERRRFSAGRTLVLVAGSLAILVFAVTAAAYASFASML